MEFKENNITLYRITLDSIVCNNGEQTWTYIVEKVSDQAKDISNWALEICESAVVKSFTPTAGADFGNPNNGIGKGNCLNVKNSISCVYDPSPNPTPVVLQQAKWNTTGGTFSFTLDKCYEPKESLVAIKTGGEDKCFCGTILGPSCIEQPPSRGLLCYDDMK